MLVVFQVRGERLLGLGVMLNKEENMMEHNVLLFSYIKCHEMCAKQVTSCFTYLSAITLKPMRGEVNNTGYFFTMAHANGWNI